jgi:formyltetrahydrofolate deformylase
VTHRDQPEDLIRKGRIIEKNVIVCALQAHLSDRVLTFNNKCVLFGD